MVVSGPRLHAVTRRRTVLLHCFCLIICAVDSPCYEHGSNVVQPKTKLTSQATYSIDISTIAEGSSGACT